MCDPAPGFPVYKGEEAKKELPGGNHMFKRVFAAALVSVLTTNTAVTNVKALGAPLPVKETAVTENDVEYQEIFDDAMSQIIGCDYTAIQLLEVQLVNGTNYIFWAKSKAVSPGAEEESVQITVHESLSGEISIREIRKM